MAMGWPYFADLIGLSWGNRMTDVLDWGSKWRFLDLTKSLIYIYIFILDLKFDWDMNGIGIGIVDYLPRGTSGYSMLSQHCAIFDCYSVMRVELTDVVFPAGATSCSFGIFWGVPWGFHVNISQEWEDN
jgi:hypothetical protein